MAVVSKVTEFNEEELWNLQVGVFADSGAELGMVFHKTVKSPNAAGMTVKHGAGGGVEAGYSFRGKDCPKEREKAIGQGPICTWKGFRFSFKRLAVALRDGLAAKRISCARLSKLSCLEIHLTPALRDPMSSTSCVCKHAHKHTETHKHTHRETHTIK